MHKISSKGRIIRIYTLVVLTVGCIVPVSFLQPVPQALSYHLFADARTFWGIPNFWNVVSNLPFVFIGCAGFICVKRSEVLGSIKLVYFCLFTGVILTGFGSAYYHLQPDNNSLVFDRIPMTIVFMALLSATIAEFIDMRWGIALLFPLLIIGIVSVWWWRMSETKGQGDLRLYALVQFYPMVFIPLILILFPNGKFNRSTKALLFVVLWYVLAKICEFFDKEIFAWGHLISGHSLKHLAAAASTWNLIELYRKKHVIMTR